MSEQSGPFVVGGRKTVDMKTLAKYVLVEAENEKQARERGQAALEELYAQLRDRHPALQVEIRIVRPATTDEIDFGRWHEEMLAREAMGRSI
jgi:hypothetical protein